MIILSQPIKDKTLLILLAGIAVILTVAFFAIFLPAKNKKPVNPIAPAASLAPRNRLTDEDIKNLTAPAQTGEKAASISDEAIRSLTAPNDTSMPSKNDKAVQPVAVPDDIIKSLTTPATK